MKNLLILTLIFIGLQACKSLTSTTYIDPKKTFVLGEGKHGSYDATIKNVGKDMVEVIQIDEKGRNYTMDILKIGEKKEYKVAKNATVMFKNINMEKQAIIEILITGNPNASLSMGYQENK